MKALEQELSQVNAHAQQRDASKDELIRSLQSKYQNDIGYQEGLLIM